MRNNQLDEAGIFNHARKIDAPQARADYVKQMCADDQALFDRVAALLSAHDTERSFLESPPLVLDAMTDVPQIREGPGTVIGLRLVERGRRRVSAS